MKIAIVRVRGTLKLTKAVADTLNMLNLKKPNHCVVRELTPDVQGMITKVNHMITWGPVDEKVFAELKKRGDKVICLNPPRKGYGKKGVKLPFRLGGAYGNRKENINELIERML